MLVRYRFVNEVVEIEVPDEWGEVLREQDRMEYNNEHRETRRHVSMEMMMQEQGVQFATPFCGFLSDDSPLDCAMESLEPDQRALLRRVFYCRETLADIALDDRVTKQSVQERFVRAMKRLCKILGGP